MVRTKQQREDSTQQGRIDPVVDQNAAVDHAADQWHLHPRTASSCVTGDRCLNAAEDGVTQGTGTVCKRFLVNIESTKDTEIEV